MKPQEFSFNSMGTNWKISIWDNVSNKKLSDIKDTILRSATEFDQTYSRFIKTSLVRRIEHKTGIITVPQDFVQMLLIYGKLFDYSEGMINPLIGRSISDLGYDETYSLTKKSTIRKTPNLKDSIKIIDETHIQKTVPCLFDFGAVGKGYFVDLLSLFLFNQGLKQFLVDGSGDIYYQGGKEITCGLEHPDDQRKVIGTIILTTGALCASGINRRTWGGENHIINPKNHTSAKDILAVWVLSDSAAISDGLSTALFLSPPENFAKEFKFEYLILNKDYKVKRSKGFNALLY